MYRPFMQIFVDISRKPEPLGGKVQHVGGDSAKERIISWGRGQN